MGLNWLENLYTTYDACSSLIGVEKEGAVLLPVSYTWQNAQIECYLNEDGEIFQAHVIDKQDAQTMIPCTVASANRTLNSAPHPLFDKLCYLAKDYSVYCKNEKDKSEYHLAYIKQLEEWCLQADCPDTVRAIYTYLCKGSLIKDLVDRRILFVDEEGQLLEKWYTVNEEKPTIFKVITGSPASSFVRFQVVNKNGELEDLSKSKEVRESFLHYYLPKIEERNLCMVTGKYSPIAEVSPSYIRYPGDHAKLISANDKANFTYRGRFQTDKDAMTISYEATQKAHNALKWLIQKQGRKVDDMTIVAWGTQKVDVISPLADTVELELEVDINDTPSTYSHYVQELNKAIAGYGNKRYKEVPDENIVVMELDSATPGRLSITYYNEVSTSAFMERIRSWHTSCIWKYQVHYKKKDAQDTQKKDAYEKIYYTGAPSPQSIVYAAYGHNVKEQLRKSTIKRLLPCIIEGKEIPKDIINNIANRLMNPHSLESYERTDVFHVFCAIYRKYLNDRAWKEKGIKEEWKLGLDIEKEDRDYLWGRALAYADRLETRANILSEVKRETNAFRYQRRFQLKPVDTWFQINTLLASYVKKFKRVGHENELTSLQNDMNEIIRRIMEIDGGNQPLGKKFYLAYQAQLDEFYQRDLKNREANKKKNIAEKMEGNENDNITE